MPYSEFTYPEVLDRLGLTQHAGDLYGAVAPLAPSDEFARRIRLGATLAVTIGTEKARSEFIIAPILQELLGVVGGSFGLYSGVSFNVDKARSLDGVCDFLLTRVPLQLVVTRPVVAIAEAKNDSLRSGLGQCIAAAVAARDFNAAAPSDPEPIHGVVTTGTAWKFLRLDGPALAIDLGEYAVPAELGKVMGILALLVAPPGAHAPPPVAT